MQITKENLRTEGNVNLTHPEPEPEAEAEASMVTDQERIELTKLQMALQALNTTTVKNIKGEFVTVSPFNKQQLNAISKFVATTLCPQLKK